MHVMLGLLGLKIGELHGDLSQTQVNDFFIRKKKDFEFNFIAIGYIEKI
jgi:hypothetical protein